MMKLTRVLVALLCSMCGLMASQVQAQPHVLLPGYRLVKISSNVPGTSIAQLAFNPNDDTHLYAARVEPALITRYDYHPMTGELSNAIDVAELSDKSPFGLAFHRNDLYVSLNGGGDGRITRLSVPDVNGLYQIRHDFVHSIPTGAHGVNQLQIVGNTLYVGIGAVGRIGDPAQENLYNMTIARIADLAQIDFSGSINSDFKGPINYLANPTNWIMPDTSDGLLRYYASGFRNPFGMAIDADGDLWLSSNGNDDPDFLSPDFLYKKVPLRGQGLFPPASFGFGRPHITGIPIQPFVDLGQSPSPTGFDFVPSGPDAGKIVLGQFGATNDPNVGSDVILIDPDTGDVETLLTDSIAPTDVLRDPFGRLLITDFSDDSVWLLCHGDCELLQFTLTVTVNGSGTVTSSPVGIDCGPTCQATYDSSSQVVLIPTPDMNSAFVEWSGAPGCATNGSDNTCTVTMDEARSITATFTLSRVTLQVTQAGTGSGTVTSNPPGINCGTECAEEYTSGTPVTLTAEPHDDSVFAGWSGDADCADGQVTPQAALSCIVTFAIPAPPCQPDGDVNQDGVHTPADSLLAFQHFLGLAAPSLDTCQQTHANVHNPESSGITPADALCIFKHFLSLPSCLGGEAPHPVVTLIVQTEGSGSGTVTANPPGINCGTECAEEYASGTPVTLTAEPHDDSVFAGWSGDVDCADGQVTPQAALTCIATFNQQDNSGGGDEP